jgi:valyl-tRNA synthetase
MTDLAKSFEPAAIEAHWGPLWEAGGAYEPTRDPSRPAFAIQLPPPNVTGTLHMGHAFQHTIMDALTRYHRMRGDNTLWVPGTDHAGIATQIVVERQLQEQGVSRHDLGRAAFVAKVWAWKEKSGSTITRQMRRMGDSVSWRHEYFTMDERLSAVVTDTFVKLYEEGLIYRGKRLVNWDPVLKSAVSDLEVESEEEDGSLWHIRYPLADGSAALTVATTRPETMLGDTAVMVHPEDERYAALVGREVRLPITGRLVPVIADAYVDRAFGTGVVKVTPAHDANDYAVAQRHPEIGVLSIFTEEAKIVGGGAAEPGHPERSAAASPDAAAGSAASAPTAASIGIPVALQGLDRFEARRQIVAQLEGEGLLEKIDKHRMPVPRCVRTGQIVEKLLTDQWFVAMTKPAADGKSFADRAIEAVENGSIRFVPEQWVNTYHQWMKNIQDWCISRQLWWGHQIPAWYDANGTIYVGHDEAEARKKFEAEMDRRMEGVRGQLPPRGSAAEQLETLDQLSKLRAKGLTRDQDVLDTWYSSALVPFSSLGWPEQTEDLKLFLPSTVLVTGHDIIFFWVARMIMMTTHFTGQVPFRDVYIHGLVRDAQGKRMSKSEGNVLDPVDLIDGIALEPLLEKRSTGLRRPRRRRGAQGHRGRVPERHPGFGADALRFTFCSLASLGRNVNFDAKRCEGYRNFCNKLWNATRFVLMNCEGEDCGPRRAHEGDVRARRAVPPLPGVLAGRRWISGELQRVEAAVEKGFADYRLDYVAHAIYAFVWDEYCDWYLEIAKVQIQAGDARRSGRRGRTLIRVLETVLRLLHPLTPFITAELWQRVAPVAGKGDAAKEHGLVVATYPRAQPERIDPGADAWVEKLKALVGTSRNLRSEMKLSPAQRVPLHVSGEPAFVHEATSLLQALAKVSEVRFHDSDAAFSAAAGQAAVASVGAIRLALHVEIDAAAEIERLSRKSPASKPKSAVPEQSSPTRGSSNARRPRSSTRKSAGSPSSAKR